MPEVWRHNDFESISQINGWTKHCNFFYWIFFDFSLSIGLCCNKIDSVHSEIDDVGEKFLDIFHKRGHLSRCDVIAFRLTWLPPFPHNSIFAHYACMYSIKESQSTIPSFSIMIHLIPHMFLTYTHTPYHIIVTIPYHVIPLLYHTIPYHYYTIPHHTITIPYHTISYCTLGRVWYDLV